MSATLWEYADGGSTDRRTASPYPSPSAAALSKYESTFILALGWFAAGAAFNKGLKFKMGQIHGQKFTGELLNGVARGEDDPSRLITHKVALDEAPKGYDMFKRKHDDCLRVVFAP